jgi:hypothetical protein
LNLRVRTKVFQAPGAFHPSLGWRGDRPLAYKTEAAKKQTARANHGPHCERMRGLPGYTPHVLLK